MQVFFFVNFMRYIPSGYLENEYSENELKPNGSILE